MVGCSDALRSTIEPSSKFPFSEQPSLSPCILTGHGVLAGGPPSGLRSPQWARSLITTETEGGRTWVPSRPPSLAGWSAGLSARGPSPCRTLVLLAGRREMHASAVSLGGASLPLPAEAGARGSWTDARGTSGRNPPSRKRVNDQDVVVLAEFGGKK